MAGPDVLIVGAGIIGAACALALQEQGLSVTLIDAATPGSGVTAAGMGHLVVLDESDDELALSLYSLGLWRQFLDQHPGVGEPVRCGTLWVAENAQQLARAQLRAERLLQHGWHAELLDEDQLRRLEPALRSGLCGAVRVAGDMAVYAPAVADFLAQRMVQLGGVLLQGQRVLALHQGGLTLDCASTLAAEHIVIAAGAQVAGLLPEVPVFGRKGHLAITDRYPGRLHHQVVSMSYGQSAGGADGLAVAANVQPRASGQWLIGSCRQDGRSDTMVEPEALAAVLRQAIALLPCLAQMNIVRAWSGMRPATPDGRPLIGAHPGRPGLWLACGHEGLGVTDAFATAQLLAAAIMGQPGQIDLAPFAPARFAALSKGLS
jgi:glycine/D-amino acid oxidase-like deaminating enzyme